MRVELPLIIMRKDLKPSKRGDRIEEGFLILLKTGLYFLILFSIPKNWYSLISVG